MTQAITTLSISINATMLSCYAECRYAECLGVAEAVLKHSFKKSFKKCPNPNDILALFGVILSH
jgi:hypothetical protein